MPIPPAMQATAFSQQGIESLRGRKDPEAVRAVAREMESLFAFEMVKAMRSASDTSAAGGKGFGGEVYGTMFDMELARLLSSKGLGLQEMILKGMGQAAYSRHDIRKPASAGESVPAGERVEPEGAFPSDGVPSAAAPKRFALPSAAGAADAPGGSVSADGAAVDGSRVPHTRKPLEESVKIPTVASPAASAPAVPAGDAQAVPAAPARELPASSVLHTHDSAEEYGPVPSAEGSLPIRDGGRVSSSFGYRRDPFTGAPKFHHGVDIAASAGTEIYPVKGGEVTFSGYRKGYGNLVEVDHGDGLVTRYAHNRANRVAAGDRVGPDTVIAEVGSTGRSTGPHLHFEVHYEGQKVPPEAVFSGIAKGRG